ncbi:MAG TPA: glycosyltransferase [Candidatus Baltobacteraceae bacterium]
MNLVIGIPSGGNPAQPFVDSLKNLELPVSITGFGNLSVTGNFVPAQRELLARHALRAKADYLLMIDDDIVVPPDAIAQFLTVFERDARAGIVGGLYYARDGVRPMAVANWNAYDTTSAYTPAFLNDPVAVAGVGFGCVMIGCNVFRALDEPYFPAQIFLEESQRRVRVCNEDYLFCRRAAEREFTTYLHAGVRLGHYDRGTGKTFPLEWESGAATNQPRMGVMRGGNFIMVPLDENVPRIDERHIEARLDYIIED